MHFWIDKRSQQCGFGRSRVAASLSHAGSGLSYGHPPRRTKSTSCSNNSGQSMPPVHRSLPQTPYDLHQPGTSRQSQSSQYGNNNPVHGQQQQHMLHQHYSGGTSNNNNLAATGTTTTASNNNNASGIASSAAVLTGSGTIVPLVARGSHYNHHGSARYQPRSQQQQQLLHQQQQQQQQHQQQQHYSYHHPQFGNMAVPMRHYDAHQQQQQQQYSGNIYADDAYSAYHHTPHHQHSSNHSTSGSNNQRQSSAYATPRRHNSSNNMRHSTTAATAATSTVADTANVASPAVTVAAVPATGHSNRLQQQHHALLQHADSQLLPSHLKCGMCASLVLASVFVAGTKFYFDHQGTGLEVLIFCAFSATFFLAACLVSLCRIPKALLSNSGRSDGRAAVCHSRGVNSSSLAGSGTPQSAGCLLEMSEGRYLEERELTAVGGTAATAGPPPYHIAILLPEQTPATMGKQLPLDESPPPSYDKILV
ncbi:GATA zinc finger domain-containing protein 10 [Drosophila eugracilis]|uniref:GATA zinc finger domain-containing protein 10 n=1 Tax=Drosophila eugracilis TaxID=29029 RepID=UPI001BDB165E|nr:GATA zinc finger domain-containing protein 10 [Drosophila eugracilis]